MSSDIQKSNEQNIPLPPYTTPVVVAIGHRSYAEGKLCSDGSADIVNCNIGNSANLCVGGTGVVG